MAKPLLVFYDSDCATCHRLIRFLMRRPKPIREAFRFLSIRELDSEGLSPCIDIRGRTLSGDSVVVLSEGRAYQRTDAIFAIAKALGFPWCLFFAVRIVPRVLLDSAYDLFAKNRYKLFGRADPDALCQLPDPELRKLLITQLPPGTVRPLDCP